MRKIFERKKKQRLHFYMEMFLDLDWKIWRSTRIIGRDICSDKDEENLS